MLRGGGGAFTPSSGRLSLLSAWAFVDHIRQESINATRVASTSNWACQSLRSGFLAQETGMTLGWQNNETNDFEFFCGDSCGDSCGDKKLTYTFALIPEGGAKLGNGAR